MELIEVVGSNGAKWKSKKPPVMPVKPENVIVFAAAPPNALTVNKATICADPPPA